MTRIKTIGFSLKFFSAKLRSLPLSCRIAGIGFLPAVLLLNGLLTVGCVPSVAGNTGSIKIDGFVLKEFEVENVLFEPQGLPFSIQPAYAYWLRSGDAIAPRWNTFEWHWEHEGAMCGFTENNSAGDCQVCDLCTHLQDVTGLPCMGIAPVFEAGTFEVVMDSGFIQTDNPQRVLDLRTSDLIAACANPTQLPLSFFNPAASGLYRLRSTQSVKWKGATNGEIKLHVVETGQGLAQKVAHQLTWQIVDGANYWIWTIEGDPLWLENFSPNLRVTDIRIFRGECADGSAKGKQCVDPDECMLVKPSRLLFLPNFQGTASGHPGESSHRCYSNPNANGGNFINLDSCRERYDYPLNQTTRKPTTPTYESVPARPLEKLTWLVEFDTNYGSDADLSTPANDPMPPEAKLIIEFTIQAN